MARTPNEYIMSDNVKKKQEQMEQYSAPFDYTKDADVSLAKQEYQQAKQAKPTYENKYGSAVEQAYNALNNREAFKYDLAGDALYQQYKDQYMRQGNLAMQDTMGQASALTGGYNNSYAQSVGQQAYQGYMQQLNDRIPELYQLAMSKYQMEGDALADKYNLARDMSNTEYAQFRDAMGDYNTAMDQAYGAWQDALGYATSRYDADRAWSTDAFNNALAMDYNIFSDSEARKTDAYKQGVSEDQFNQSMALDREKLAEQQHQFDVNFAENQYQFDAELAEKQRQFNDEFAEKQRQFDNSMEQEKQKLRAQANKESTENGGNELGMEMFENAEKAYLNNGMEGIERYCEYLLSIGYTTDEVDAVMGYVGSLYDLPSVSGGTGLLGNHTGGVFGIFKKIDQEKNDKKVKITGK